MLTELFNGARVHLAVAVLAVIGPATLWGQAANGAISGFANDPSGAAIAGATVEVKGTHYNKLITVAPGTLESHAIPRLPSVHIGSDRASGRDVLRVA
jgi:hypothetical protein